MNLIIKFFRQPSVHYRNFQIVFTLLTLNFIIPAISYSFFPDAAIKQFSELSRYMGNGPYTIPENMSRIWRYLAAANVMTLGVMCLLLQINLKKFYPILIPLVFLKSYNAILYLLDYMKTGHTAFLAVALFDFFTSWAFIYFARSAFIEIRFRKKTDLFPSV